MAAAQLPPADLDGLDPSWSRLVTVDSLDGVGRTFHLLDTGATADTTLTLLCVHGNPSWSYLWRDLLAAAPDHARVIAPDHLDMGFSERTGTYRRLADRIDDLDALAAELAIDGPVVTVAHDWGGPISLGWALRHTETLDGVVLCNTAVHQPEEASAPQVIRAVRKRGVLRKATVDTAAFIEGAFQMSNPRPTAAVRAGFLAPYRDASRREAIQHFVEDIPLEDDHPTAEPLDAIAAGIEKLTDTPTLLVWGSADKVFSDLYLHDLEDRLPHADVHRHPKAGHFVTEDADVAGTVLDWITTVGPSPADTADESGPAQVQPLGAAISDPARSDTVAVIEMSDGQPSITFGDLADRVAATARGLQANGVEPGDRVALMIPPSIELVVALYGCWQMGAVVVLVDSGLGPKGMSAAVKSAAPDHLIGIPKALAAARTLGWPGRRISSEPLSRVQRRLFGAELDLPGIALATGPLLSTPDPDALAAIPFTSGSTGPSKGVLYTQGRIDAQRKVLVDLFGIGDDDRLVAAFAPFALYGPAMGITSVVPDMDVTAPATLTASALGDACVAAEATMVFASPTALANVVKTAGEMTTKHREALASIRLLMSAGAPVRPSLLDAVAELFPNAAIHTPYGMTECLPVASIERLEIEAAAATDGDGVCVGRPLNSVDVRIRPFDSDDLTVAADVTGEVVVRAPHMRVGYDRLWRTTHRASQPPGWHATGDVGHLDAEGRLWIGGRLGHVIHGPAGPVMPVRTEQRLEDLDFVEMAAVVGVGPEGAQRLVAVVQTADCGRSPRAASIERIDAARAASEFELVAMFEVPKLPVDRRHNAKIDRSGVADWAAGVLAGGRMGSL